MIMIYRMSSHCRSSPSMIQFFSNWGEI